jgi:hypothetical protein
LEKIQSGAFYQIAQICSTVRSVCFPLETAGFCVGMLQSVYCGHSSYKSDFMGSSSALRCCGGM